MKIKIGINGMGRIGRMIARSIVESNNKNIEIRHINNRTNSEACSTLLKYDSIHGKLNANINFDDKHIIINKNKITFSQETDLKNINWAKFDVDYVFECTGKFNSKDKLEPHLKNGAKKAIQKYGDDAVKAAMKENNLKTVGDKVLKKRMTVAEKKALSKKVQKEDFPKQKPTNKLTRQEEYLEELEALSRFDMKAGGLLSDDRNMYKDGGPLVGNQKEIDANNDGKISGEDFKLLQKAEGGEIDDQMLMVMTPPMESEMEPDGEMEDNYTRFIMEEALSEEEEDMLTSKLEQDEELSMLFDKIIDVAQEFAGSGPVEGPGSGVSDSIPARLSDGEFVFTAKAVEEIGEDTLMSMMKEAEAAADERQGFAEGEMVEEKPAVQPLLSQSGIVQDDPTVQDELTKRTIGGSKSYIQS